MKSMQQEAVEAIALLDAMRFEPRTQAQKTARCEGCDEEVRSSAFGLVLWSVLAIDAGTDQRMLRLDNGR